MSRQVIRAGTSSSNSDSGSQLAAKINAMTQELYDGKLDKITTEGGRRVYVAEPDGSQGEEVIVSNQPSPNSVPQRNENGTFAVGDPTQDNHPAHKKYVDDLISDTAQQIVYINDVSGVVTNGTSQAFISSLLDKGFVRGFRLVGMVQFADFPANMINAELTLDIFSMNASSVLYVAQLASTDTAPYIWFAVEQSVQPMRWRPIGSIDPTLLLKWENVGTPNGVAPLDTNSKVPSANLPGILGGNVIEYTDKILNVAPDTATLRIYHSGDPSMLENLDDEVLLAFIIVALVSETQRGADLNWESEKMQSLCQVFHEARIVGIDISGTLSGQHLMANMENISASYDQSDMTINEIIADYTMPTLGRNLQSNTAHMRAYIVADEQSPSGYKSLADIVFGGGTFQSRWTANSLNIDIQPGATVDLFQAMLPVMPYPIERGLQGMSFDTDFNTGVVKFPSVNEFVPYDIDIRIAGTAGSSGIHAFKINLVRVQDDTIARSYKSLYVDTNILANESILGISYTDGMDDPYILNGMRFVLENSAAGDELTITDIDITIQGTRS